MRIFAFLILFSLSTLPTFAQAPGTILFTKGKLHGTPDCYFKAGEEAKAPLSKDFSYGQDVCFRVYAREPLGADPSFSVWVDGTYYKGGIGIFDWPDRTTGFWTVKGVLFMHENQNLPRGKHCLKVDRKDGVRRVVVAEGCYNVR